MAVPIPTISSFKLFKLASESEVSLDDTESICSLQNIETDFIEDTPDTETKSERSDSEYSQYEFEIESSPDEDVKRDPGQQSTGSDEDIITAGTIAAVLCDSSVGRSWVTDDEDTDSSSLEPEIKRVDFWKCIQCKNANNNPLFRFCQQCFQERKQTFPPRPRRRRRSTLVVDKVPGSSLDSGISSFTEHSKLKPYEPDSKKMRTRRKTSNDLSDDGDKSSIRTSPKQVNRKRKNSSGTETIANKKVKIESEENKGPLPEIKELCVCCNSSVKDGIFIHGKSAHLCFCYKCSLRTLKSTKRCPICNRRVNNVVKVFTS